MATWKTVNHSFERMLAKLEYPPIKLVRQQEFKEITGHALGRYWGRYNSTHKVITVAYRNCSLQDINNTLWHELAHGLFPSKPHWWIECFAHKMSPHTITGLAIGRYASRYCHGPSELPSKEKLLSLSIKASHKLAKTDAQQTTPMSKILRKILED